MAANEEDNNEVKNLKIEAGLHMRVKVHASETGQTIQSVVENAIRIYLPPLNSRVRKVER